MLDWSALTPQLIIAAIGLGGSLLIFYATNWYVESKMPNVDIILPISTYFDLVSGSQSESGHIILNLVNTGKQSANNIRFALQTRNNDIVGMPKISGNEKWDLVKSNSHSLVLDIPRLSVGEVPMITIDLKMKSPNNTDYKASATFDQGSTQVDSSKIWSDSLLYFYIFRPISGFVVFIGVIVVIGAGIYYGGNAYEKYLWPRHQEKRDFLLNLSNDIIGIRSHLMDYGLNRTFIPTLNDWYSFDIEKKRTFFKTTEEYIRVDDFYAKLKDRNSKIKSISDSELMKYNTECISLADQASKYINVRPKFSFIRTIYQYSQSDRYQKVASIRDLHEGALRRLMTNEDKEILLSMVEGKVYATDYYCTHQGGPLGEGELKGYSLKCPWHYAVFDIRNGKVSDGTMWATNLNSYPVKVDEKGNILVNLGKPTNHKQ
jgi:nitrite reductase/ring-hydroxylating ferredoxin subunit